MELAPRVSPEFELTLDNTTILHAIETLNFFQMKGQSLGLIVGVKISFCFSSVFLTVYEKQEHC